MTETDNNRDKENLILRIKNAKADDGKNESENQGKYNEISDAYSMVSRVIAEMVAPIIVGVLIGYGLDEIIGESHLFLPIFILIGIVTGLSGIYRMFKTL